MKNLAIFTLVGLVCGAIGIFTGYFFLKSINGGANIIFLIVSLVFIVASIVCLYLATNPRKPKLAPIVDQEKVNQQTANMIDQNNTVLTQWNKTNETRDRLKILKIAGVENEEEAPQ